MSWLLKLRARVWRGDHVYDSCGRLIRAFQPSIVFVVYDGRDTFGTPILGIRIPLFDVIFPKDFHRFDDYAHHAGRV